MSEPLILLVEDDPTLRFVAGKQLKRLGVSFDLAVDGKEAVSKFQDCKHYQIIFMDLTMPEMDGIEAARNIREVEQKEGRKRLPIILMTAHAECGRVLDAGMDDYIGKPVLLEQLREMLSKWLPGMTLPGC